MLRAASETRQRCSNHPHRRAIRQCARCRNGFCEQCARDLGERGLCDHCQSELDELERITNVPAAERVRRFGASVRRFLIGLVIFGIVLVPIAYFARDLINAPLTPEEFARFRYAAAGTFETAEGVNVTSTVLGAKVLSATSSQPGHEERRLIDEYVGPGYGGYRTADATFPQEVVIEASSSTRIEKVIATQQPGEPPETMTREIEVLVATASPDGPYQSIGRFTLEQTLEPQRFTFPGVDTHWIKLLIFSNYGGPYASLGELDAYVPPRGGPFAPTTEPTTSPTR